MARRLAALSRRLEAIEKARATWPDEILVFKETWETPEEALEIHYQERPGDRPVKGKDHGLVVFIEYADPLPEDPDQGPLSIRVDGL